MSNAESILCKGFDDKKIGSEWGSTYGPCIYFSPTYEGAACYGEAVLVCEISYSKLLRLNTLKLPKKLIRWYNQGYDALITQKGDEIVVPSIKNIKILRIK